MTQIARQPGLVYERTDEGDVAPPVSKYARARALAAQAPAAPSKYAAARALAAQSLPSSPGVAATITQPGGMPSTTASQLTRPGSLENLGGTIGDFAQAGADFVQSAPYGMMKDGYDQAAGLAARVANIPAVGRAMEAVGLHPDLANDTSGYQPDVQPPDSIAGQLGRGVGSVGGMFAASALTGGSAVVLPLVAGAQSLGATYQAARQRALQMGADDQQAHQIAAAEADTMGLVSTVTSLPVGRALSGIAPQALSRAVATANRGGQLGQLVRVAAAEGSQEAAEEAAQMVLQRVAEDDPEAFQDWQRRIAISAGAGAIGGGLIAGVQAVGSQQGQRQAPQDYPAQRGALASFSPQNAQQFAQPIPRGEQAGPEASVESVEQGWPSDLTGVQAWDKTAEETARENELKARAMRGEPDRPEDQAFRDQLQSRLQALVGATPQQAAKMSHGDWQKWANARRNGTPDQAMDIVAAAMLRGDDIAVSAMKNEMADKLLGEPNEDATPSERAKFQKNQDDWRATLEAVEEVEKQYKAKDKPTPSNLSSLTLAELRSLDLQRGGTGKGTKAAVLKRLAAQGTSATYQTTTTQPQRQPAP